MSDPLARSRRFAQLVAEIEEREGRLETLATNFLSAAGYDQAGEPVDGDDRGVLEPIDGLGWLSVNPDLRAIAEEHCTPNQLAVMRAYTDGLGMSEIARKLNMSPGNVWTNATRAGRKLVKKCGQSVTTYRGNDNEGPYGGADHSVLAEHAVLCGPRSPEGDPERIPFVPFFPANDRRDLYWTTLPQNARDIRFEPATVRGPDDDHPDVVAMRPVPDFYPDPGIQDVDSRRVLLTTIGGPIFGTRSIVTVQADGESAGKHAARHKRRVEAWLALDENRPRLPVRVALPKIRSRILPNAC